jgi:Luciferase-like monooxygenase
VNISTPIRRGLGISAGLDAGLAGDLAVGCEQLGYHSLWSNDEPGSAGLETLAHVAAAAPQLELGVGVLPSTDISRSGSRQRSLVLGWTRRSSGSGSGPAS